jgi:hypothetical protein
MPAPAETDFSGVKEHGLELGGDFSQIEDNLRRFEGQVQMIVGDVGLLKACEEDESITFGGLGLQTLQECNL